MEPESRCPGDDCPTVGVEATPLSPFGDVATDDEWLIYDVDNERGWIQSNLYLSRESCV
jgi:hypothetical protein